VQAIACDVQALAYDMQKLACDVQALSCSVIKNNSLPAENKQLVRLIEQRHSPSGKSPHNLSYSNKKSSNNAGFKFSNVIFCLPLLLHLHFLLGHVPSFYGDQRRRITLIFYCHFLLAAWHYGDVIVIIKYRQYAFFLFSIQ
jgi:hypothetical protein